MRTHPNNPNGPGQGTELTWPLDKDQAETLLLALVYGRRGRPVTDEDADRLEARVKELLVSYHALKLVLKGVLLIDLEDGEIAYSRVDALPPAEQARYHAAIGLAQRRGTGE